MGVGFKLKKILREKKMTIKQLSEISGISINTLYSITKRDSERVDRVLLCRIASALSVSPEELLEATHVDDYLEFIAKKAPNPEELSKLDGFLGIDDNNSIVLMPGSLAESVIFAETIGIEDEKYREYAIGKFFKLLNSDGQQKAIERVKELTEVPKYQRQPEEGEQGAVDPQENDEGRA